ncbi:MAG: ATP-binding protein, partial [Roseiflexaceae bacterium]
LTATRMERTAICSAEGVTLVTSNRCPDCGGIGYYKEAVPIGHPRFGMLIPCKCKLVERERRAANDLLEMSNLSAFHDKTFATFDHDVRGVKRAYIRALEFAKKPEGWVVFFGNYGTGKTHLASAIANELLQQRYRVLFAVVPDLLDHLRSTFGPTSEIEYDKRFEMIRDAAVLVLDDLGTENTTPWAREKLFQIINHRYNGRLPTVITSNRRPEEIEPRIFSRMSDRAVCEEFILLDGEDYRQIPMTKRRPPAAMRRKP